MSGEHYFDLPIIGKYLKKVIIKKVEKNYH